MRGFDLVKIEQKMKMKTTVFWPVPEKHQILMGMDGAVGKELDLQPNIEGSIPRRIVTFINAYAWWE